MEPPTMESVTSSVRVKTVGEGYRTLGVPPDPGYTIIMHSINGSTSWPPNRTNITDDWQNLTANVSGRRAGDPTYYSIPYTVVGFVFVCLIFTVGLIGNVMVVIVVSRTRSMHTPTNCYLVSLAIADCLVLVSAPLPTLFEFFYPIDQWILGQVMCPLTVFVQYLGVNVSSLSITAFTVERYIAICHPMKAQTMCTVRRAKRIIAGLWIFGICYNAPWLWLARVFPLWFADGVYREQCNMTLPREHYTTIYLADLVLFYVIPLILTCVLYGMIARILFSSTIPSTLGKAKDQAENKKKKKSVSSSRTQVVKMLAVVVGLFAIFWLPYRAFVVYNSFATHKYKDLWFRLFCRVMVYMNSAINPILYNAMSVKFRRAFKRLLSCGRRQEPKTHMYSEIPTDQVAHNAVRRLRVTNGNGLNVPTGCSRESYL